MGGWERGAAAPASLSGLHAQIRNPTEASSASSPTSMQATTDQYQVIEGASPDSLGATTAAADSPDEALMEEVAAAIEGEQHAKVKIKEEPVEGWGRATRP